MGVLLLLQSERWFKACEYPTACACAFTATTWNTSDFREQVKEGKVHRSRVLICPGGSLRHSQAGEPAGEPASAVSQAAQHRSRPKRNSAGLAKTVKELVTGHPQLHGSLHHHLCVQGSVPCGMGAREALVQAACQCSAPKGERVKEVALARAVQSCGSCGGELRVEEEGGQPMA